jgi:hypothetical protein
MEIGVLDRNPLSPLPMEMETISPFHGKTFGDSPSRRYAATHRVWDHIKKPYICSWASQGYGTR